MPPQLVTVGRDQPEVHELLSHWENDSKLKGPFAQEGRAPPPDMGASKATARHGRPGRLQANARTSRSMAVPKCGQGSRGFVAALGGVAGAVAAAGRARAPANRSDNCSRGRPVPPCPPRVSKRRARSTVGEDKYTVLSALLDAFAGQVATLKLRRRVLPCSTS